MKVRKFEKKELGKLELKPKKPIVMCELGGYCGATTFLTCPMRGSKSCKRM